MSKEGTILFILGLLLGISTWSLYGFLSHQSLPKISALRSSDLSNETPYKFIDPLLSLRGVTDTPTPDMVDLQKKVQSFVDTEKNKGNVNVVSVSMRDFGRTTGFVINPDEKYLPASLLKVQNMIAYFKASEEDSSLLNKKLLYTGAVDYNKTEIFSSSVQLEKDKFYSVDTLIQHMIKHSDNNAASLLLGNLNSSGYIDVFTGLFKDLGITDISLTDDYITVRGYDLFFRVLYNATYLRRDLSERALLLLSQTDFLNGIVAGVPNDIVVSHKFGELSLVNEQQQLLKRELHDCGIVYYPHHPYMICIMTKGSDFSKLESVLAGISRIVFEHQQNLYQ